MALFDRLTERVEGFLDDVFIPEDLRRQLERASRLIERDEHGEALSILRHAESQHSPHHRTYHLLGLAYFGREQWSEAHGAFERAAELREEPATHLYAGLAAEQLGEMAEAKLHFQKALGLTEHPPFEFDLYFGLGRTLAELERTDRAIHELHKARELEPDDERVGLALAHALFRGGRIDEADELLEELDESTLAGEGWMLEARIAERRGAPDRAARLFERVLDEHDDRVDAMLGAARAHLAAGAPALAQQYLLEVVERGETPAQTIEARTLLGEAAEKADDDERALDAYRLAIEEATRAEVDDPVVDRARLGAGRLAFERGDVDEAARHFETITADATGEVADEARLELARVRLADGQHSEARRLLDELATGARAGEIAAAPDPATSGADIEGREAGREFDEEPGAPTRDGDFGARVRHVGGLASLDAGDPAEALVAFQDALHLADRPELRHRIEQDRERALRELRPSWELPDDADSPLALEQVLEQTRTFLQSSPHLERFVPRAHDLQQTMAEPVSVAIVGEFNVGKSTLVNALLDEEVVPMGILPTTAHTCYIRYGPRKTARVVYRDEAAADTQRVVEVDYAEARRRMDEETDAIAHLEFLYPHPQLRSLHFWDTPGFNAFEQGHDEVAARAIEEAEAILWVFDAKQTLTRTELDRLEAIDDGAERVIGLVNKADELDDEQLEEVREHLDRQLGPLTAGSFAISAREALEEVTGEGDDDGGEERDGEEREADGPEKAAEPTERAGFEAFRTLLDRQFVQRAGRIKTLEVRRRLVELVDDVGEHVDELLAEFERMSSRVAEITTWLDELADRRPGAAAEREATTVDDQFDFALDAVAREIREALRPRGTLFATKVLDEADRSFALDLFKSRLDDVLRHSRRRVVEEADEIEAELTARLEDLLEALSVQNARSLNRRLDGLYDELRTMRLVLAERVYGQLRARIHGRIDAAGPTLLDDVAPPDSPDDLTPWKRQLRTLLPDAQAHVDEWLTGWYREFFRAAERFSDRVRQDLQLLRLEADYRYDTTDLRAVLET